MTGVLAAVDSRGEWERGGGEVSWDSSFTVSVGWSSVGGGGMGAADGPDGSVGAGGTGAPPDWVSGSACGSGAGAAIVLGLAPLSTVACSLTSSAAPSGWPADASFSSSSATVLAPPRSSACAAAISSALLPFWDSASCSTSSRCSIAYWISFSTALRLASRTAVSWMGGMSKSYSTRFLIRTAISESRPSSISGTSHGRSSGS